ncbi:unnamed protein product, partial [Prunus brigantina]
SSVAQPVSAGRRHRPPSTTDTTSTDGTGALASQPAKKNTRGPCRQLKTAKVTRVTNSRINIGYDERHRAATTAELHSSLAHDIGHVIRAHCPMKWKSWKVMPDETRMEVRGQLSANYNLEDLNEESLTYVNRLLGERRPKQIRAIGTRRLFSTIQVPGHSHIGWTHGSKFPEIDVFGDVYVRHGNELAESLYTTMVEKSQLVLQESASQLPPDTPLESVDPPHDAGVSDPNRDLRSDSREEARDILSRDGECPPAGISSPFRIAVKQSGDCFDGRGGRALDPDVTNV